MMINEIRMLLAETLLGWCLSLAPDNEDGARLVKMIRYYLKVVASEA